MKQIVICVFTLLIINTALGQIGHDDSLIFLYKLDRDNGKYLFTTSVEMPESGKVTLTVIGDTFAIQPSQTVCYVVMSNAYVLQTDVGPSPSNKVAQIKMLLDVYRVPFPKQTKLVFNDSIIDLPDAKIDEHGESNAKIYEGQDALRQMKKMGMELPDDMDVKKAVGQ